MTTPRFLNLDEVELPETDISILHEGKKHFMRTLSVDMFVAQQKRAAAHEKHVATHNDGDETDMADIVELIRNAVTEFFPTFPAGDVPTAKLFMIFAWLNEMAEKINADSSADVIASAEGKAPETETAEA